jgi:hypothetical protein
MLSKVIRRRRVGFAGPWPTLSSAVNPHCGDLDRPVLIRTGPVLIWTGPMLIRTGSGTIN